MSRQSLPSVLITVFLVSTWTILKVDALAKVHVDEECQELYQNFDRNPRAVDLDTLQKCIDRWGEKLLRAPNDVTLQFQHKRMQNFLRNAQRHSQPRVPPARLLSPGGPRPGQGALKQPNVIVAAQQPQEGQSKAKRFKVESPAKPVDFIHRQLQPVPYLKPRSPQATASKQEQCNRLLSETSSSEDSSNLREQCVLIWNQQIESGDLSIEQIEEMFEAIGALPVKVEQQAEVAGVQQPQSSVASSNEVYFELLKLQKIVPPNPRHRTLSSECMELIEELLVTPDSPLPTGSYLSEHHIIVKDCAKLWERLHDKAVNDNNKQTGLKRELGLMKARLDQINEGDRHRGNRYSGKDYRNERALKIECEQLAGTLPHNSRNLATLGEMLEYKAKLDECIAKWEELATHDWKRLKLGDELELLNAESTRVEHLIGVHGQDQGQQNVGSGPLHVEAPVQVETDNRQRPSGSNNRNFDIPRRHRSKHSKKVRNRMAKSKSKWSKLL